MDGHVLSATRLFQRKHEALPEGSRGAVQRLERRPVGRILKPPCCRPRGFESARQFRQRSLTTRQPKQHGRLCFRVRGNVLNAFDFLARCRNILCLIKPPCQHRRQDLSGAEKSLLFCLTLRKGVWQIHELNEICSVFLPFKCCGISNVHVSTSLQLHAALALYGREKTGAKVAGTMNWNRDSPTILCKNVVAAMNAIKQPAGRLQLREDFLPRHVFYDRSLKI